MKTFKFLVPVAMILMTNFANSQTTTDNQQKADLSKQEESVKKQKELLTTHETLLDEQKKRLKQQEEQKNTQEQLANEQKKVMNALKDALTKDGFINPGKKLSFNLSEDALIINGGKHSQLMHEKYIKLISEIRKRPFDKKEQWNIKESF